MWTPQCPDPIGLLAGYGVKDAIAQYLAVEERDAAWFEKHLDEKLLLEDKLLVAMNRVDVRMAAASGAVICQSSAGVIGTYFEHPVTRDSPFLGLEPVYVTSADQPFDWVPVPDTGAREAR